MKNAFDIDIKLVDSDFEFDYQKGLTQKLDNSIDVINQNVINEIVLWKVNRYAEFNESILNALNSNKLKSKEINIEYTGKVLNELLYQKGVQLPMASTILRFINLNVYQIIDQRVYRILYKGKSLKLKSVNNHKNNKEQIEIYLQYLIDLRSLSEILLIPFKYADRILYKFDKRINKNIKLDNY
jgi:hypothetical protein